MVSLDPFIFSLDIVIIYLHSLDIYKNKAVQYQRCCVEFDANKLCKVKIIKKIYVLTFVKLGLT